MWEDSRRERESKGTIMKLCQQFKQKIVVFRATVIIIADELKGTVLKCFKSKCNRTKDMRVRPRKK